MVLETREFFDSVTRPGYPRLEPSAPPKVITLASGTALLPIGTPVAVNTSTGFWVPWALAGANGTDKIGAFIYDAPVQLVSGKEVQAVVLWRGRVHRDDVNTAAIRAVLGGTSPALADVDTALRDGLRAKGIDVTNLSGVS